MDPETSLDLKRVRERNSEALHTWVHRYYDDIFRFLRHLTRQRDAAEDLAQQTFINAFQGLNSFREESSMRTWLHRIAFREYIAWRRKRRIYLPLEVLSAKHDKGFEAVENEQALLVALHQLPSALREAFLLFEVQQLSIEEIADITGSSEGTVKSRLHHARKKLEAMLESTFKEVRYEFR